MHDTPSKEHLEAVSRLLEACRLCGAKYHETHIEMSDRITHSINELPNRWVLSYEVNHNTTIQRTFPKIYSSKKIQIALLSHHLEILQILL